MKFFLEKDDPQFNLQFVTYLLSPVAQWVQSELLDDWRLACKAEVTEAEFVMLKKASKAFLSQPAQDQKYHLTWSQSVLFISMLLLSRKLLVPWVREFSNPGAATGGAVDADEFVIGKIEELYDQWKAYPTTEQDKNRFAQPYAFYLLFKVIAEDQDVKRRMESRKPDNPVRDYLSCTLNGRSILPNNRLTDFAKDFYRNGKKLIANVDSTLQIASTGHFAFLNIPETNIARLISWDPINILAVGKTNSGKTSVLKMIKHVISAPDSDKIKMSTVTLPITALRVVGDDAESKNILGDLGVRAESTGALMTIYPGQIKMNGNENLPLTYFDIKGGLVEKQPPNYDDYRKDDAIKDKLSEKGFLLEALMTDADLLIIVLDPETMYHPGNKGGYTFMGLLGYMEDRLDFLFHKSAHPMIAIVFAKFDEYGAVIRGPRNLIHNEKQAERLMNLIETGSDESFVLLVEEIAKSYEENGEKTPLSETITVLLARIRSLLKQICYNKNHPVINCYMASTAIVTENHGKDSLWTGYPELLNDFANYIGWLKKEKEIKAPTGLKSSTDEDSIELQWSNENTKKLYSIVERKDNDGEYKPVGEAKITEAQARTSFRDTKVRPNLLYTYRVHFSSTKDAKNKSLYSNTVSETGPYKPPPKIDDPKELFVFCNDDRVSVRWRNINITPVLSSLEKKVQGGQYNSVPLERQQTGYEEVYEDIEVDYGKTYFYRVRLIDKHDAENKSDYQEKSVLVSPRVISQPVLGIAGLENSGVRLTWSNGNGFLVEAVIERKNTGNNSGEYKSLHQAKTNPGQNGSFYDSDVEKGREYIYRLKFISTDKGTISSEYASTIPVRTKPKSITTLQIAQLPHPDKARFIELSWDAPENAYRVIYWVSRIVTNPEGVSFSPEKLTINCTNNFFADNSISEGNSYKYMVTVVEPSQQLSSDATESNTVKIELHPRWPWILLVALIIALIAIVWWALTGS